jgi:hypothetical protein
MVRCSVDLAAVGRLVPAPFVCGDGRAIAWLEVDAAGVRLALYGSPGEMRALARAALAAAEQAQAFGGVAGQIRVVAGVDGRE